MKKTCFLLTSLLLLQHVFATTHIVQVTDYQFIPANINVNVGDSIEWIWVKGGHTSTSGIIPAGADAWDSKITKTVSSFKYKITVSGIYNYICKPHADFGMVGTITASDILPVTLQSFEVTAAKDKAALLLWSTATEKNTDHFEIMRSTNGINFEKIASVPAKGNSFVLVSYAYTDDALPSNYKYLYYSLSMVDKDGKKALSGIKMFRNENGSAKLIVSLTPNPVSRPGHLMLQFNSEKDNVMHVQLFDHSGKLVKEADMTAVAGLNNGHFHIGDVASGTYIVVFKIDALKESYKVVVQ